MSKTSLIFLMSSIFASGAFAQTSSSGITMSTDPARAAAVERHAQELKARPAHEAQVKPAAKSSGSKTAKSHTKPNSSATKKQGSAAAKPVAKK
jgi:hypothetical protein